ncbi:ATP-binding protein [Leptolyngbya sp. FACHB-17]|uniref:hybrid sensor histidine kinase/response regulator n=1 Tax=unclassified Leptolyngbya TaxID=2650499 RepID=UPI0016816178|nr:ATP-binding protein [Leptolyngbya sp. FACHB-17]MBD2079047.1 response regulator [Leptolyngbya sp. FACHB-17]
MSHGHDRFSLLDQIPLGVCVLRADYQVVFWNHCLEEWTKIPRDRIKGQAIREFFPRFAEALYVNRLAPIFAGGPPTIFSSQLHHYLIPATLSNGSKRIQHTTITAIPADEGDGFYAMISIQDVTDLTFRVQEYRQMRDRAVAEAKERKYAQERAESANRVKDEFLAVVSHELRTPLNPILGWSKLLAEGRLSGAAVQRALETIARNAALQAQLIDDLLDVSRILRGKLTLARHTVDLVLIVQAALDTVRLMAENKGIAITLQTDRAAPIVGDTMRLQQVVWNLLTNAIKFTPEGGTIEVTLRRESKQTVLSVQDTGTGIAPDFLPFVFEAFRQADASSTRKVGGLGLGLAITRNLVELHGGTIKADSTGVNQGSTFAIALPNPQAENQVIKFPHSLEPSKDVNLVGVRVLIIDDEQDSRDLIQFVLESSGAIVTATESVAAAIAALNRYTPDLIVSDLGMPEANGFDLIQAVRSRSDEAQQIPAIALTAYASELTQQQALLAGFQQHLVKPIHPDKLLEAVSQLVMLNRTPH